MKNFYDILGVKSDASADEIKRAYRKLASQHHPDKGGDKSKFQELEEAYRTLSNPQTRAAYDNPRPDFGNFGFRPGQGPQGFDFDTIFDIFGTRFNANPGAQRTRVARMNLWITLSDVARGGRKTVSVGTHSGVQAIEIEVPVGINDGDSVQYTGLAPGGGDLIIQFRIHPDPKWQRNGGTIICDQTISFWDCILGAEILITDILGNQMNLVVPAQTQPGTVLRLRGRGLPQRNAPPGDLLIKIQAKIPENINKDLLDLISQTRGQ